MATASNIGIPGALSAAQLRRRCDPASLGFETTAELAPVKDLLGQRRAADALAFGLAIGEPGFNLFVAGPPGTGKTTAVRSYLEDAAHTRPAPSDWCYVHNFRDPSRPSALRLPPGQGRRLRDDLVHLVQAARREIPRAFESEEYIAGRESIVSELNRRREQGLAQLSSHGQAAGFSLQLTPMGIGLIPVMGNRPLGEDDLAGLRPEMRELIQRNREAMEVEIRAFLKEMRGAERETRERLEVQDRDVALHAVGGLVEDLVDDYPEQGEIRAYLDDVREGILADIALFRGHPLPTDGSIPKPSSESPEHTLHERAFRKYEVNVVVDNGDAGGAPVVTESNPTYPNLVGRVEREALFGALLTDFTLISSGALQRANGGFLVLRAADLLRVPAAWDALKRALRERAIVVEDLGEALGLTSAKGLRPDPIPLEVKVVLLGEPLLYAMLHAYDPDFRELFKVRVEFDTAMDRTPETETAYAALLAACGSGGRPLHREAVAWLIEESSRLADDQRKLSVRLGQVQDLVHEAQHWAAADGAAAVGVEHVKKAVDQRMDRSGLARDRLRELIARGVLLIRPDGAVVGQVHGLAVVIAGEVAFGHPTRITATVGAGRDGVVDIERQAELGGRIHSKGVMIIGGYLADTYAGDKPLALAARLVFEQSYDVVEGDSASLAELLALLSRLADVPLKQGIAVTGSVNQRGDVQAIGGINEKIEGFFDACQAVGLSDEQGVMVPAANVEHLMLREDVVETAAAGRFHVYAVHTVDEALEILAGIPADQIHARVHARLRQLAESLRDFAVSTEPGRDGMARAGASPAPSPSPTSGDSST